MKAKTSWMSTAAQDDYLKHFFDKGCGVVAIDNDLRAVEIARKKGITAFFTDINDWKTAEKFERPLFRAHALSPDLSPTLLLSKGLKKGERFVLLL